MTQLVLTKQVGWREKAPSKADRLRELLADGRWHGQQAMERAAGMRYGARLFDLHAQASVASGVMPLHYEKEIVGGDDSRVRYRQTDKGHCDICTKEARETPTAKIERLEARVRELEKENAGLRARFAAGWGA